MERGADGTDGGEVSAAGHRDRRLSAPPQGRRRSCRWLSPAAAAGHSAGPCACLPQQDFAAHELMEGVYASEATLHRSVAFLRNTLAGGWVARVRAEGAGPAAARGGRPACV